MEEIFKLVLSLLAILALLAGCWLLSRWLAGKVNRASGSSANMRLVERVALTPDKGLAIMEVCGRHCLVGYSPSAVTILRDIDESELKASPGQGPDFLRFLSDAVKKAGDRGNSHGPD